MKTKSLILAVISTILGLWQNPSHAESAGLLTCEENSSNGVTSFYFIEYERGKVSALYLPEDGNNFRQDFTLVPYSMTDARKAIDQLEAEFPNDKFSSSLTFEQFKQLERGEETPAPGVVLQFFSEVRKIENRFANAEIHIFDLNSLRGISLPMICHNDGKGRDEEGFKLYAKMPLESANESNTVLDQAQAKLFCRNTVTAADRQLFVWEVSPGIFDVAIGHRSLRAAAATACKSWSVTWRSHPWVKEYPDAITFGFQSKTQTHMPKASDFVLQYDLRRGKRIVDPAARGKKEWKNANGRIFIYSWLGEVNQIVPLKCEKTSKSNSQIEDLIKRTSRVNSIERI